MMSAQLSPARPAPAPDDVRQLNDRLAATSRLITILYERLHEATEQHQQLIKQRDARLDQRDEIFVDLMAEPEHRDALEEALTAEGPLVEKLANGMRIVQDDEPAGSWRYTEACVRHVCLRWGETFGDEAVRRLTKIANRAGLRRMNEVILWAENHPDDTDPPADVRSWHEGVDIDNGVCNRDGCTTLEADDDFADHVVRQTTQETADLLAEARNEQMEELRLQHLASNDVAERGRLQEEMEALAAAPPTQTEVDAASHPCARCVECDQPFFTAFAGILHCPACIAAAYQRDEDDPAQHDANGNA